MKTPPVLYHGYQYPGEIISHAVWLYGFPWRHEYQFAMHRVDIRIVCELLRHSTIQVTMRYAHLSPKNVRDAVNRLSQFRPTSAEAALKKEKAASPRP